MHILLIEDDENKRLQLTQYLEVLTPDSTISIRKSYNSGLRAIKELENIDVVLLDMSLPTYDIGHQEDGGRPQHYGGRLILRQMDRHGILIPTVVVTQFDVFGEEPDSLTRDQLDLLLRNDHKECYQGMVYYTATLDEWKEELSEKLSLISQLKEGN